MLRRIVLVCMLIIAVFMGLVCTAASAAPAPATIAVSRAGPSFASTIAIIMAIASITLAVIAISNAITLRNTDARGAPSHTGLWGHYTFTRRLAEPIVAFLRRVVPARFDGGCFRNSWATNGTTG